MARFDFPITKEPPEHISVSQVRKFQKCQVQWYFDKCTETPSRPGDRMLLGNYTHAGLAQANMLRMNGAPMDEKIITNAAMAEFTELTGKNNYVYDIWKSPEAVKRQGDKILARVVAQLDNLTGLPMMVEHAIGDERVGGSSIVFSSGHSLVGYVDLVDVNGSIWDFKVGKQAKSQSDADQDLQMSLYTYALHGIPTSPVKVGLLSVNSGEKTAAKYGEVVSVESARYGWQCEQAYEIVDAVTTQIAASVREHNFTPTTEGWHCGPKYCDYWHACPFGGGGQHE